VAVASSVVAYWKGKRGKHYEAENSHFKLRSHLRQNTEATAGAGQTIITETLQSVPELHDIKPSIGRYSR